jgi:hypothetical protein
MLVQSLLIALLLVFVVFTILALVTNARASRRSAELQKRNAEFFEASRAGANRQNELLERIAAAIEKYVGIQ